MRSVEFKFCGVALGSLGFTDNEVHSIQEYLYGNGAGSSYPTLYAVKASRLFEALESIDTEGMLPNPTVELLSLEDDTLVFFGPDSL